MQGALTLISLVECDTEKSEDEIIFRCLFVDKWFFIFLNKIIHEVSTCKCKLLFLKNFFKNVT